MKAFWWFRENAIAGMARPGFNSFRWFDLAFDEAVLLGWLGLHSSGSANLESFRRHLQTYAPRIFRFHKLDDDSGPQAVEIFRERAGLEEVLARLAERSQAVSDFSVDDDQIHFQLNRDRLDWEVDFLKERGIGAVVTLTENHHSRDVLGEHFDLHHIAIEDLGAPKVEQVMQLAEVIKEARANSDRLAVHCLAGIGRTSTMLIGAHMVLGEKAGEVVDLVKRQNPAFVFSGAQAEFVRELGQQINNPL